MTQLIREELVHLRAFNLRVTPVRLSMNLKIILPSRIL